MAPPAEGAKVDRKKVLPIRPRFVRTYQSLTLDPKDLEAKSRIVISGHYLSRRRKQAGVKVRVDAPVAPQCALYMLLSIASTMHWALLKFDVEAAFLTGKDLDDEIYLQPPKEGLRGVSAGSLLKAVKRLFAFPEAPRMWWLETRGAFSSSATGRSFAA